MKRNYTYDLCNKRFEIRLPSEEYLDWKREAELLNVSMAEYVRQMVRMGSINFVIKEEVDISGIREIMAEYGKIGSNINQIAHSLNAGEAWSRNLLCFLNRQLDALDAMHLLLMEAVRKHNGNSKTYRQPKRPLQ